MVIEQFTPYFETEADPWVTLAAVYVQYFIFCAKRSIVSHCKGHVYKEGCCTMWCFSPPRLRKLTRRINSRIQKGTLKTHCCHLLDKMKHCLRWASVLCRFWLKLWRKDWIIWDMQGSVQMMKTVEDVSYGDINFELTHVLFDAIICLLFIFFKYGQRFSAEWDGHFLFKKNITMYLTGCSLCFYS